MLTYALVLVQQVKCGQEDLRGPIRILLALLVPKVLALLALLVQNVLTLLALLVQNVQTLTPRTSASAHRGMSYYLKAH